MKNLEPISLEKPLNKVVNMRLEEFKLGFKDLSQDNKLSVKLDLVQFRSCNIVLSTKY